MSDEDLENKETSVEIEEDVVDESEGSQSGSTDNVSDEEELQNYSASVQRRINQLTERRKHAEEETQAAFQYVNHVQQENALMKRQLQQMNGAYTTETENRLNAQEGQVLRILQEAKDSGDTEREVKAHKALTKISVEKDKLLQQKNRLAREQAQQEAQFEQEQFQQQQQAQQPVQHQPPPRDLKLESWMGKNPWFGSDRIMTRAAQAIHEQLTLEEGFDPRTDDYYNEIDSRMRAELPHKFNGRRSNAQTVAPASSNGRTKKIGRKRAVDLTPGQVSFAKKFGIPLEKMATEVAKKEARDSSQLKRRN